MVLFPESVMQGGQMRTSKPKGQLSLGPWTELGQVRGVHKRPHGGTGEDNLEEGVL